MIKEFMDRAAEYSRVDAVSYVQTPLYVDYDSSIANQALEQYVRMISNGSYYGSSDSANPDWNNLYTFNQSFDNAWNSFTNLYLNTWGGKRMIEEYSAEAKKYLK